MSTIIGNFDLDYPRSLNATEKRAALKMATEMGNEIIDQFFSNMKEKAPLFKINNRLTRAYGRYSPRENMIEMSGQLSKIVLYIEKDEELYRKVLKHELAHWFLHKSGKKYGDGEPEFEEMLIRIDSVSSGATNKNLQMAPATPILSFKVHSVCEKCGASSFSNRRTNGKYMHVGCRGILVDKELVLVKS